MSHAVRIPLALALSLCLAGPGRAQAPAPADRIWSGGAILTMNDGAPRAEALAEKDGKIVAVGSLSEVMSLKGPRTEVIDLAGRAMLPGFFDAHGHVFGGGLQALSANLLAPPDGKVESIAALQQTLRDWIAANKDKVEKFGLVIGFGWDPSTLKEQRAPTRQDLDAVSTEYPVYAIHQSAHLGAANSKALALVGYDKDTKDPEGGVIRREPDGAPNGVLEETAHAMAVMKLLSRVGPAGAKEMARAGAEMWASFGYTTVQEGAATPVTAEAMRQLARDGGFKVDVAVYPLVAVDKDYVQKSFTGSYDNRFRVAGGKLVIDGSPQGFTAWRDRPYYAPVGDYPPAYVGYNSTTPPETAAFVDWAYTGKIPLLVHSNGEAASDSLIAATDLAVRKHGPLDDSRRITLIHGQFLREDQLDAVRRLRIFPSLFPMHTFYWGDWHRDHTVGPELADNISPTGWAVKRGMIFATHHDAPVAFPDSMRVLSATVTRRSRSGDIIGPAQRVDVMTALKAMTIWPAWQQFEGASKGSLEVGKLADLVILSRDPTAVDPETLADIKVVETIKDGAGIYAATPQQQKKTEMTWPGGRHAALGDMIRDVYVERVLAHLPPAHRTAEVRAALARDFDDCLVSAVLGDVMTSDARGEAVAVR
ncbi:MAG: amidohydrolase [Alsobacter sp.]